MRGNVTVLKEENVETKLQRNGFDRHDALSLLAFLLICFGVSALGAAATASSVGDWYQQLHKPPFNPPDQVFAPVWSAIYLLIAIAGWRVWRLPASPQRRRALWVYGVQLLLNLCWSLLFFGMRQPWFALFEIVVLESVILCNLLLFWRIERLAGMLLLPYLLWVAFATLLNGAIALLN